MLERETGTNTLDWSLLVEGGNLALLRFVLDHRGQENVARQRAPWMPGCRRCCAAGPMRSSRPWQQHEDESRAAALATRYAESFPSHYRSTYSPEEAALDICRLRHLAPRYEHDYALGRDARLFRDTEGGEAKGTQDRLRLKVYQHGGALPLSDAVPALENFGFRVLLERPTEIAGEHAAMIHDFTLGLPAGLEASALLERDRRRSRMRSSRYSTPAPRTTSSIDSSPPRGSAAQEADWLRAFYRYLRQANIAFTIYTVIDALAGAPAVTRGPGRPVPQVARSRFPR